MHRCHLLPILCQLALLASAHAITSRDDVTDAAAQTLAGNAAYASVGKFTRSDNDITSGVLIDPYFVLSAAHIIQGFAGNAFTFTIGGFNYQTVGYTTSGVDDLAVFQLASPVNNVTPALPYTGSSEIGAQATIVGFGQGGTGSGGATGSRGTKRAATNVINATAGSGRQLVYDFDSGLGGDNILGAATQTSNEGVIAYGDSGGGAFAFLGGDTYLIGIHLGVSFDGDGISFNYGDLGFDTRVSTASSFIQGAVPEPSSALCLAAGGATLFLRRRRRN